MKRFLLDANVFIESKGLAYPFDVFPGFWEWLERDISAGLMHSIDEVFKEIAIGNDELVIWAKNLKPCGCFMPKNDEQTQLNFAQIANWVMDPGRIFTESARKKFLSGADPWLIAKAMTIGAVVVTQETFDDKSKKSIKIPNVCCEFGVGYINTIDLIRQFNIKFGIHI